MSDAGIDPATLGPFAPLVEALDVVVRARIGEGERVALQESARRATMDDDEAVHPDRFYTAEELAERWRMTYRSGKREGEVNTTRVYEIAEEVLPRRGGGGRSLFWGLDVMLYEGTITREQFDAVQTSRVALLPDQDPAPPRLRPVRPRDDRR